MAGVFAVTSFGTKSVRTIALDRPIGNHRNSRNIVESFPMKIGATLAALAASFVIVLAGCQQQSNQAASQTAQASPAQTKAAQEQTAATAAPTNAQNAAPKSNTVVVFSASAAAPQPAPAPKPSQVASQPRGNLLNLPELNESFTLQAPARAALETTLSGAAGKGPVQLSDESAAALMAGLSDEFRNSCNVMLSDWASVFDGTGRWTVRVLYSLRRPDHPDEMQAVLAFHCSGGIVKQFFDEEYFDERPAVVSLTPETATLTLVPVLPQQDGESVLFRLEFSQAFTAVGAQLVELRVYHSSDNPCCGGGDEETGNRLLTLDLATGKPALDLDENRDHDSHDDENEDGDIEHVCNTKLGYQRDAAGNVTAISVETHCKDNGKPLPEVTPQLFRWNPDSRQFIQAK